MVDENLLIMLGRMDGKLDALVAGQAQQDKRLDNHGDRIKALEEGRAKTAGFFSAARLAWAGVGAALVAVLKHFGLV